MTPCVMLFCSKLREILVSWLKWNQGSISIQWNPSGNARKVPLKLQNLVHFDAAFFTSHVYITPHASFERPPYWVAFIEGFPCIKMPSYWCRIAIFKIGRSHDRHIFYNGHIHEKMVSYWNGAQSLIYISVSICVDKNSLCTMSSLICKDFAEA